MATLAAKLRDTFKDIDLSFEAHPITGDIIKKTGVDAILQSIRNLVLTAEGEFVGELDIGGGASKLLFRTNDRLLSYELRQRIIQTIKNHEPRAEIKDVDVFDSSDRKSIFVKVIFYALNQEVPFEEVVRLTRIR